MTKRDNRIKHFSFKVAADLNEHTLNYVEYTSSGGTGIDKVVQHKYNGVEYAHITLHPNGVVNIHGDRDQSFLIEKIRNSFTGMSGIPREFVEFAILVKSSI